MFKLIGVCVLGYVAWALWRGEVYARSGMGYACHVREEAPGSFWATVVIYTLLGIALLTVF